MKNWLLLLAIVLFPNLAETAGAGPVAPAAEAPQADRRVVFKCFGGSFRYPNFYAELLEDENGKLGSAYTMGSLPIYYPTWTKAGEITTPPQRLPLLLWQANQYRDTGISPTSVKKFQMIFIDGAGSWDVELWKLLDEEGELLGYVAWAYGSIVGCY